MGRYADWKVIVPEPGEPAQAVAEALLAVADSPETDVQTIMGGAAFRVHPDVAARYNPTPAAPKRRRRAPRKDDDA